MNTKQITTLINELRSKYKILEYEYNCCYKEIEKIENKKEFISDEMENIESNIKKLNNSLLNSLIQNCSDNEDFLSDFIKASLFCNKKELNQPLLEHVNITENEFQATDGYKLIIIRNNNIPEELKNTKIHWSISENFKENIGNIKLEFLDIEKILPKKENAKYKIENIHTNNFNTIFAIKRQKYASFDLVFLSYKNFKIAFQKKYLKDVLTILKDTIFNVYMFNSEQPILIESDRMQIILAPVRHNF